MKKQTKTGKITGLGILGAISVFTITGCVSEEEYLTLETKKMNLENEIVTLKSKHEEELVMLAAKFEEKVNSAEKFKTDLAESKQEAKKANIELDELRAEVEKLKVQLQEATVKKNREEATGANIGELELKNGETFLDSKISVVDPAGIKISHASGLSYVPYEKLPEAYVVKFGFNEGEANAFIKAGRKKNVIFAREMAKLRGEKYTLEDGGATVTGFDDLDSKQRMKIATWESQIQRINDETIHHSRQLKGAEDYDKKERLKMKIETNQALVHDLKEKIKLVLSGRPVH